ncbi:MAG: 50S ribosomal protein L3 [Ignavibacteriaceae bacterium]|nr:50S ribosomal protein L3 [Ignavibacteriaceae bacterium]
MSGLLGKKLGMSSVYNEAGNRVPVTAIEVGPCRVIRVKSVEKDGYSSLQLGFGVVKEKKVRKPELGYYKKHNLDLYAHLKEFRFPTDITYKVGDEIKADFFTEGELIKVRGTSKGKGFQGVMRRHGFGGVGGTTHGQSDRLRAPGSIGASSYPSRVFKGQKMAGRTGGESVTVSNLRVMKIFPDKNIILVKGAVPGAVNSIVQLLKKRVG